MAFVATGRRPDGKPEMLGLVQAACDPDNVDAEFAILVRSDLKAHGLGHVLMDRMIDYLRANGTRRLVGDVLQENAPMRALVHDCGFAVASRGHLPGAIRYELDLASAPSDPGTVGMHLALQK
jgi:acetyltransferase